MRSFRRWWSRAYRFRLRALALLLVPVLLALLSLASLEALVWGSLLTHCPAGGRLIMYQVLRRPLPVSGTQLSPPHYSPTTLEALREFQAKTHAAHPPNTNHPAADDRLWNAVSAAEEFAEHRELTPRITMPVSLALADFREPLKAFQRLIQQPDFAPDMDFLTTGGEIGAYSALFLPILHCPTSVAECESSALNALQAYESFRGATTRTPFYGGCDEGMRDALGSLAASCRACGDTTLARRLLKRLEALPPPIQPTTSPDQKAQEWAFGYYITAARELQRSGQPLALPPQATGLDLIRALQNVSPRITNEEIGLPENPVLRALYVGNWGPWSTRARELHFLNTLDWAFGHTFPLAGSVAHRINTPPVDRNRVAYDRARLNLAAQVYRAEQGNWPATPSDLVPACLPSPPQDPGPRGPYVWSPAACDFDLRQPPAEGGII